MSGKKTREYLGCRPGPSCAQEQIGNAKFRPEISGGIHAALAHILGVLQLCIIFQLFCFAFHGMDSN